MACINYYLKALSDVWERNPPLKEVKIVKSIQLEYLGESYKKELKETIKKNKFIFQTYKTKSNYIQSNNINNYNKSKELFLKKLRLNKAKRRVNHKKLVFSYFEGEVRNILFINIQY